MYFKKLVGKKCYLSPIDVNDAGKFTEWLNDMEILTNLQLYSSIISVENEKTFLGNLSRDHNYSIIDLETEEIIGNCGFWEYYPVAFVFLLSYYFIKAFRREKEIYK